MATIKRQRADGSWDYIQMTGEDLITLKNDIVAHLADGVKHTTQTEKDRWNDTVRKSTGGNFLQDIRIEKAGVPAFALIRSGKDVVNYANESDMWAGFHLYDKDYNFIRTLLNLKKDGSGGFLGTEEILHTGNVEALVPGVIKKLSEVDFAVTPMAQFKASNLSNYKKILVVATRFGHNSLSGGYVTSTVNNLTATNSYTTTRMATQGANSSLFYEQMNGLNSGPGYAVEGNFKIEIENIAGRIFYNVNFSFNTLNSSNSSTYISHGSLTANEIELNSFELNAPNNTQFTKGKLSIWGAE